jgi:hypothetical protein
LVIGAELLGGIYAEARLPACDHPVRVRGLGGSICNYACNFFAGQAAQHCVDHAGGVLAIGLLRELDTFADGGVGGDAVEKQELVGAEAQRDDDAEVHVGIGFGEPGGDLAIEHALPAQRA